MGDHALGLNVGARNDKRAPFVNENEERISRKKRRFVSTEQKSNSMSMDIDEISTNDDAVICPVCSRSFQRHQHFVSHIKQKRDSEHRKYCQQHYAAQTNKQIKNETFSA